MGGNCLIIIGTEGNANGDENPNPEDTDEEYTRILVRSTDTLPFKVFWLVPDEGYFVRVLLEDDFGNPVKEYVEFVDPSDLSPSAVFSLNSGHAIFP